MRGNFVFPAVTVCAAALTLPFLATPSGATAPNAPSGAAREVPSRAVPGTTRSLPLGVGGHRLGPDGAGAGLEARRVSPFSLVGIVWDDAAAELRGRAQVRTRAIGTGAWSAWQDVQTHDDDRPDPGSPETRQRGLRGSTAPLWVGPSDGVEVRVAPDKAAGKAAGKPALPSGLHLELVDPGAEPAAGRPLGRHAPATPGPEDDEMAASAANAPLAPLGATEIPALGRPDSARDVAATRPDVVAQAGRPPGDEPGGQGDPEVHDPETSALTDPEESDVYEPALGGRYVGPRPRIVTRAGWGADESLRERGFVYTGSVRAAFVHHTASGNEYSCSQSGSVIRGIYRYHVVSSGWRDIGYNFLVDKCGTIYEGRAGGVAKPVKGAHTLGFNTNSMGIAVLGTFAKNNPSYAAVDAVATLTAWKLGLYDVNPLGTAQLVSGGGNLYKKGTKVRLKVISGHRDGYATECPGDRLYSRLGSARSSAARLQGR
ncbi:N-acetylmuramoyl-L-alanine amidase [Streptomyces cinnamoneus]|uniref:N-acetylmuramoyl-L-alanine amidase n=1 Tax=Streptomyces cinnamoneus TaxID=53446 RepID=A0A2G1XJJ3_STRCJ|nr:N-acetylmuramoyl-L-alanine amidase [Streptomyces cinnamoneus]PHQ51309.1 N-acetylmuramoyl-L-alanine amidase [Streptomyces cinnamoneus]PPT13465.1 N-acetylmuramoyl-L-alanine amidase [Streptomyces cinnamoneus]